jgi:hypothetical protein
MTVPRTPTTKGQPRPPAVEEAARDGARAGKWARAVVLGDDPNEPADERHDGDVEAIRARRCLDGLFLALLEHHGTAELDQLLFDADRYATPGAAWTGQRHGLARDYAERLFRGRP